jgi:thiol-disulfide isomerase/thioredoxin
VTGRFSDGGKPVAGALILLFPIRVEDRAEPTVTERMQTHTDAEGRFSFARVPPGPVAVSASLGPWEDPGYRSGPAVPVDLMPGRRVEVDLGIAGATVTGRVVLAGQRPAELDCAYSLNNLYRREPTVPAPQGAEGFDIRQGYRASWAATPEGQGYLMTVPQWFVKLAPDGSFRVSGVPAGEYDLAVRVYAKPTGCLTEPLAQAVVRVSVSKADVKRGEVSVPDVTAEVRPVPEVGTTPTLAFRRADGSTGTLADVRGKPTLVHIWASWCAPCKRQLPSVARFRETATGMDVLGLSLDEDAVAWQEALGTLALTWPQGRVVNPAEAGLSSVPAYWLLDASGVIVAKANDADELPSLIEEHFK